MSRRQADRPFLGIEIVPLNGRNGSISLTANAASWDNSAVHEWEHDRQNLPKPVDHRANPKLSGRPSI